MAASATRTLFTPHATPATRAKTGVVAREAAPPAAHSRFERGDRVDPVAILQRQAVTRVPELVPIRYGRMLASPFAFFRGAAAVMAADLAGSPDAGLRVQLCGDAHLLNFGLFASPERRLVFDVNDFDETHPGPWEWDVKRLAASMEVAARDAGFPAAKRREIQHATVCSYQQAMAEFAAMRELEVWYAGGDVDQLKAAMAGGLKKSQRKTVDKTLAKARGRTSMRALGKLTEVVDGRRRIVSDPPLVVPVAELLPDDERSQFEGMMHELIAGYRSTLQPDRRSLLDAFDAIDVARKVVGVGSVGTRCWIVLLQGRDGGDPLFLQVKEAQRSVVAEYGGIEGSGGSQPRNQGERVVCGQRLMQAASDIFLGWQRAQRVDDQQRDFYVRQLADQKGSAVIERMNPSGLATYGKLCASTLARAHARCGDRVAIASYLGKEMTFAHAIAEFSAAYADQNERDYAALKEAARIGDIPVESGR